MYPEPTSDDPGSGGEDLGWDQQWHNVEAGGSLAAFITFDTQYPASDIGDHAGEAYFRLDGTDTSFAIIARVDYSKSPAWVLSVRFDNGWNPYGVSGSEITLRFPPDGVVHGRQS
jgi:hypothetical protein